MIDMENNKNLYELTPEQMKQVSGGEWDNPELVMQFLEGLAVTAKRLGDTLDEFMNNAWVKAAKLTPEQEQHLRDYFNAL